MSEEKREILKMVADKTITVEEAERLLRALGDAEQPKAESTAKSRPKRKVMGICPDTVSDALSGPILGTAGQPAPRPVPISQMARDRPRISSLPRNNCSSSRNRTICRVRLRIPSPNARTFLDWIFLLVKIFNIPFTIYDIYAKNLDKFLIL